MTDPVATPKIHAAILNIMRDVGAIGKNHTNEAQRFKFRGIDDVYNAAHTAMIEHRVYCQPETLKCEREERDKGGGKATTIVHLLVRFRFVHEDGSYVDVTMPGEAMDSGDKATNKALSAAHKYAFLQMLCIPTNEVKDIDASSDSKPAKVDITTGATVTKKPVWLDIQKKEGGELRAAFMKFGGDAWVSGQIKAMAYTEPVKVLGILRNALAKWSTEQREEAQMLAEGIQQFGNDATALLVNNSIKWDWSIPSEVIDALEAAKRQAINETE